MSSSVTIVVQVVVQVVVVPHRILNDVENGEGVSKRGKRVDVTKASYKCLSIHEGGAWTMQGATVLRINVLLRRSTLGQNSKSDGDTNGKYIMYKHNTLRIRNSHTAEQALN